MMFTVFEVRYYGPLVCFIWMDYRVILEALY